MGLGFIVTIAGIVRTYYIWMAFMSSYDETWYSYPLWIAAAVEIDLAIITACAPSLKPLLAIYAAPLLTTITKRSRTGTHDHSYGASHELASSALAGASTHSSSAKHSDAIALHAVASSTSSSSDTSGGGRRASAAAAQAAPHVLDSPDQKRRHAHRPLAVTVRRSFEIEHSDGPFGPPPPMALRAHPPPAPLRAHPPRSPEPGAAAAGPKVTDWGWARRGERSPSGGEVWVEETRDGERASGVAPVGQGVRTAWLDQSSGESE